MTEEKAERKAAEPVTLPDLLKSQIGTLKLGEPHPAAIDALRYVKELGFMRQSTIMESLSNCAIEGNRLAEVCGETLRRVLNSEPVSDRYVLGLAWIICAMDTSKNAQVDARREDAPPTV